MAKVSMETNMTMKSILGVAALALSLTVSVAEAASVQFELNGVTDGAGNLSGTFNFDADTGLFSDINIASTGGDFLAPATFAFDLGGSSSTAILFASLPGPDFTGGQGFAIGLDTALDDLLEGQSAFLRGANIQNCLDAACSFPGFGDDGRGLFSTSVTRSVSVVPLPAGGLLLLSGLAGVVGLRRRKNRVA